MNVAASEAQITQVAAMLFLAASAQSSYAGTFSVCDGKQLKLKSAKNLLHRILEDLQNKVSQ